MDFFEDLFEGGHKKRKEHGGWGGQHDHDDDHHDYHDRNRQHSSGQEDKVFPRDGQAGPQPTRLEFENAREHHGPRLEDLKAELVGKLLHSKAALLFIGVAAMFVAGCAVVLLLLFMPLISKSVNYIQQNGVKGLVEGVLPLADKIWEGSAKK